MVCDSFVTATVMIIRLSRRAFLGMAAIGAASTETDILRSPLNRLKKAHAGE
jgi:hypothetical protein